MTSTVMLKFIFALAIVAFATAEWKDFTGYRVFRVTPRHEIQKFVLQQLNDLPNEYNFWNGAVEINKTVDLMVASRRVRRFKRMMAVTMSRYSTFIEDVQALIDAENSPPVFRNGRIAFDWNRYHTLKAIYNYMDDIAFEYPNNSQVIIGGTTYEGRQIKGIKLSFKSNNSAVFIEGGTHGREWMSTATATYLIKQLLGSENRRVRKLAESYDWYIFPTVNPDSYVYTHTYDRFWSKTRKPINYMCNGTDLNHNWEYKWMQGGSSCNPCWTTYGGPVPFSEIETKSLSEYITSISGNLYAYISFHGYGKNLHFPYGHTTEHLDNYDDLYAIGEKAIRPLSNKSGDQYQLGNTAVVKHISTGNSVDWVKHTFNIPLAFTYGLNDNNTYGFLIPADQIIPTGRQIVKSLVALFKEARIRSNLPPPS